MRAPRSASVSIGVMSVMALGLASCSTGGSSADCAAGQACVRTAICKAGQASAQFQRQVAPPSLIAPWHRMSVSLTYANCSGQTWKQNEFTLRPARGVEARTWGTTSVSLPLDVPDGNEITVPFEVAAPPVSGAFSFSWAVVHEGIETYEEPSPPVAVRVAAATDCSTPGPAARFRTQVPPTEFVATGSPVHASVTFANCSTETWTSAGITLGSRSMPDDTWGVRSAPLPFDVPPSREVTIPVELTAPTTPGNYVFAWQLQRGSEWLSEAAPPVTSTVLDRADCSGGSTPARFVDENVPGELGLNQVADVSERFANCSGKTWDGAYSLDSALPGMAHVWGAGPIALPFSVGPGFMVNVPFQIHAPGSPGDYLYGFGIATQGALLDQPSPRRDVSVRCMRSCNHDCGDDGCGGSCGDCQAGWSCDGSQCQPAPLPSCGAIQWWNRSINYQYVNNYGWHDTDLNVSGSTPVQLRHDSHLDMTGVYAWGYMPEFTDMVTGDRFKMLHLRPQQQNATTVGRVYPAGFIVGLSGGDTFDTGLNVGNPPYSTGAHLCIQTLAAYRDAFPAGQDACR